MSSVEYFDDPVLVEARLSVDAPPQPRAFLWQGRLHHITDTGRQWQEESGGRTWHCYLVRAGSSAYELRLDPAAAQWRLVRAWTGGTVA